MVTNKHFATCWVVMNNNTRNEENRDDPKWLRNNWSQNRDWNIYPIQGYTTKTETNVFLSVYVASLLFSMALSQKCPIFVSLIVFSVASPNAFIILMSWHSHWFSVHVILSSFQCCFLFHHLFYFSMMLFFFRLIHSHFTGNTPPPFSAIFFFLYKNHGYSGWSTLSKRHSSGGTNRLVYITLLSHPYPISLPALTTAVTIYYTFVRHRFFFPLSWPTIWSL